tara:strand:- start:353 stop:532 length:180 start_codon:yes stop_codon:yes gene_type:complete
MNKLKYKLIKDLSFYLLLNSNTLEELKKSKEVLMSCKHYNIKQIKELIQIQEEYFYMPF